MIDEETKELIQRVNYITPLKLVSGRIVEYDIKAANINTLKQAGKISDEVYRSLLASDKRIREITIGKMISKDPSIYTTISKGIKDAKYQLCDSNDIRSDEIVRIANDAVYVNRSYDLKNTDFGYIHFKEKGVYSVVLHLNDIIVFYWNDSNGINIETKGLGKLEYLHQNYMLSMIGSSIYLFEQVGIEDTLKYITNFYKQYISRSLPIEYYRELNSGSYYSIINSGFKISNASNEDISMIDISYNLNITRELYTTIFGFYEQKIRSLQNSRKWS